MSNRRNEVQVLLLAGRAGVGKTTVAYAVSARLQQLGVTHCHVEGDNLDAAYPKSRDDPQGAKLTEANLAALWRNYRAARVPRMIYVNTVCVIEADLIARAVGEPVDMISVLLSAEDATIEQRLQMREGGSQLRDHLDRSHGTARLLERRASAAVHRVPTDRRSPDDIAAEVVALTGWTNAASS